MARFTMDANAKRAEGRFENVSRHALNACMRGLMAGMQVAFRQSQREVPVRTGVLKNSGQLTGPEQAGAALVRARITYGGAASRYAAIQHDDRTLRHPRGGKAGFVTDPVNDAIPDIRARMERALRDLARE